MTVLEKLQQKKGFTPSECGIAEYLLAHRDELAGLTIQILARETYSSNATIIRMCKSLGFSGFRELRMALVKEQEAARYVVGTTDYTTPFRPTEPSAVVANRIYSLYKNTMDEVQAQLDMEVLEQIARTMMQAQRVFLFGLGDVKLTLHSFMNKMVKIDQFPILATENGEETSIALYLTRRDCAVFVTYSAQHESFAECLQQLKQHQVPIIVLTANPDCELVRASKLRVIVPDLEREDKIATFYSQLTFEYLLNLIFALIYRDNARRRDQKSGAQPPQN